MAVMNEIDVEAVERIDVEAVDRIDDEAGSDAPEYVLYGGKGGVGKTTMAAATALSSARAGVETLVISTDPAHSLSDIFERPIPSTPERISADHPLYAVEIDPDEELAADGLFDEDATPAGPLSGLFGEGNPAGELLGGSAMPGADEAAAFRQLLRYVDDDRFERVIIDTAPTGHTLRLLELPDVMDSMVGTLLELRERFRSMMDGMGGLFGGEDPDEVDATEADLDDLRVVRERVETLRATLTDPARTDFRIVMVPEEMSVVESERLRDRLSEYGIPVGTVVVNRVMERVADVTGIDDDPFVGPDLDDCPFCQRRWEVQREALTAAQDLFRGHEIRRVPLLAEEVRGERALRVVAACLDE